MKTRRLRTLEEKRLHAEVMGSKCLADANEAEERGAKKKAESLYDKGQYWLDQMNSLQDRILERRS